MTEPKLLDQESIVTEQVDYFLRTCEQRDRISLRILVSIWDHLGVRDMVRTVFPMTRTGILSFAGLYGGSRSTERTGHPYEM